MAKVKSNNNMGGDANTAKPSFFSKRGRRGKKRIKKAGKAALGTNDRIGGLNVRANEYYLSCFALISKMVSDGEIEVDIVKARLYVGYSAYVEWFTKDGEENLKLASIFLDAARFYINMTRAYVRGLIEEEEEAQPFTAGSEEETSMTVGDDEKSQPSMAGEEKPSMAGDENEGEGTGRQNAEHEEPSMAGEESTEQEVEERKKWVAETKERMYPMGDEDRLEFMIASDDIGTRIYKTGWMKGWEVSIGLFEPEKYPVEALKERAEKIEREVKKRME